MIFCLIIDWMVFRNCQVLTSLLSSEPLRSLLYPFTDPKTLILQIITYTSHIALMKEKLTIGHSLSLIIEFLYDSNEEHVLLALNTIANVALRTSSHRVRYYVRIILFW